MYFDLIDLLALFGVYAGIIDILFFTWMFPKIVVPPNHPFQ